MSTSSQQRSNKEQFWRRVVRDWRGGGLSVRLFCQARGLAQPNFYFWRRTIAERDRAGAGFVPVRVVPEEKAERLDPETGGGIELVLGGDRVVRLGPGFDAPTLQRLLALLEEGQP